MIEASYQISTDIPPPRTPRVLTPTEKGSCAITPIVEKPDLDFQSAGLELRWSNDCTVTVCADGSFKVETHSKSAAEAGKIIKPWDSPYYLVETGQRIIFPTGFQGLILPHHRFYDPVPPGGFSDFPAVVPRIMALDYWPGTLNILCRRPRWDTEHIFYAGEPFCQIIPIPRGDVAIRPTDSDEERVWKEREAFVTARMQQLGGYEGFLEEVRSLGWIGLMAEYPKTDEAGA